MKHFSLKTFHGIHSLWILYSNTVTVIYHFFTYQIKLSRTGYSAPERKLIILFSYYGITILSLLVYLAANLRSLDNAVDNASNFTLCSAGGQREECNQFREELNSGLITSFVFDLIFTFFTALVNIINLLYVLQYRDVKEVFQKIMTIFSLSSEI